MSGKGGGRAKITHTKNRLCLQNRRVLHHSDKIRLQKSTDLRGLLFAANILKLAELRDTLWVPSGFSREGPDEPANAVFSAFPGPFFSVFQERVQEDMSTIPEWGSHPVKLRIY